VSGVRSIVFYGTGEVAELAYLYLQLTPIRLSGIIDEKKMGKYFFGHRISGPFSLKMMRWDLILLTRLEDTDKDIDDIIGQGIDPERVATL